MLREELIAYAIKYAGNYNKIVKAYYLNEKIEPIYNVEAITIMDDDYPSSLLSLKNPPLVLFYKGNKELLKEDIVGVIGSRRPCEYAINMTNLFVNKLVEKHCIISGLAKGIDTVAHLASIKHKTIAVLGSGIDYVYPIENKDLYNEICDKHLILSEYPGMVKPYAYNFPFRNRIIAALSSKIFVMQASLKSGTFITVNEALNLGKDIYALPFNIDDDNGVGTNRLILEGANILLLDYFE